MKAVRTIEELRSSIKALQINLGPEATVGLVPTMGYLHEGHASLIRRARKDNGIVVVSIFVNPIQFGPGEDYETYPRDEARDLALAEAEGADLVFLPSVETMYPQPTKTKIMVSDITTRLCGASRPGHFEGVTTVVKAGPKFEILAENSIDEYVLSSIAISEGQLFLRGDRHLYAIGERRKSS